MGGFLLWIFKGGVWFHARDAPSALLACYWQAHSCKVREGVKPLRARENVKYETSQDKFQDYI